MAANVQAAAGDTAAKLVEAAGYEISRIAVSRTEGLGHRSGCHPWFVEVDAYRDGTPVRFSGYANPDGRFPVDALRRVPVDPFAGIVS